MALSLRRVLLASLALLLLGAPRAARADGPVLLLAPPADAARDPIVAAAAQAITKRLPREALSAEVSADGALAWLARLRKTPGAAFVRADLLRDAFAGAARFDEADPGLRALAVLHDEVVHVVARRGIDALEDLRGRRVALGEAGSGDAETARALLAPLQIGLLDLVRVDLGSEEAARALAEGKIDAFVAIAPAPCAIVARALEGGAHLVPLPDALVRSLGDELAYPRRVERLDARTYPSLATACAAEALPLVLCAGESLPRGAAEDAVEALFAGLPDVRAAHPAAAAIGVTRAASPAPVSLHKGAIRFFERKGPLSGPIAVKTILWVYGISDIDIQKGTYAFNGSLDLRWTDPRLAAGQESYFEFINDEDHVVQSVSPDTIGPWRAVYGRLNGRLRSHFTFERYPFDRQRLEVEIEHPVLTAQQLVYVPEVELDPTVDLRRDRFIAGFALDDWEVESVSATSRVVNYGIDGRYSRYTFAIVVRRALLTFLMKDLVPVALMVILALAAGLLPSEKVGDKLMVTVLALLVAVELQVAHAERFPSVAYLTAGDWLFVLAYFSIAIGVVQPIVEYRLLHAGREAAAERVRRGGMALAATVFVVPLVVLLVRRM